MEIGDIYIHIETGASAEVLGFTETQVTYKNIKAVTGEINEFQSSIERFESEHELTE